MAPSACQPVVLLTLGRLPVALDLARGFDACGWRVIAAEPFGMHLLRMSRSVARTVKVCAPRQNAERYREQLHRIINEEQVSLVVPVSEETPHVSLLADLPAATSVFCASHETLLSLHDKLRFYQVARDLGLSVPPSCASEAGDHASVTEWPFVAKPRLSCSGRGVTFHDAGESGPFPTDYVLQQRIRGREMSSFSVACDGQVLSTTSYESRASSGSVAVVFEKVATTPAIDAWINTLVQAIGYTGFIAFDFIEDEDGVPFALECNPRANSGIHFLNAPSVAQAIISRGESRPAHRRTEVLQESYSSFTALLGSVFRASEFKRRASWLRRARDVTWCARDPWPFLGMMINTAPLIWRALRHRRTFAEVAALDIEWSRRD